ncbi:ABC transporter substrate-binding protein [Leifsonia sp. SIMBA_070]|uniref:ABC transporter substrate-binding protein n=1 Tax=Leifsonia sp. SIMBA_070 TaxID=3085810 RepID=UPI00397AA34F
MHSQKAIRSTRRAAVTSAVVVGTAALLLAGCASGGSATTGSPTSDRGAHITFLNQSRGQQAALTALAAQYGKKTGVIVTVDTPGPVDFPAKLQADAQSKQMPDIYSALDHTTMAPFYKAGWAMDLSKELKGAWGDSFSSQVIKLSSFDKGNNLGVKPGTYSVHWETLSYAVLADDKNSGLNANKLPQTTDDLIKQLAASNRSGTGGFSVAASLTPYLLQNVASNWLTDQQISDTFNGKYKWTSAGWKHAFQFIADLKKAGAISGASLPGGANDNPTVETNFFTKHTVGAYFDASPGVSVGHATSPDYTAYFSFTLPKAPDGKYAPRSAAVPGKGASINPRGKNVQASLDFVKWLTEPAQQKYFADQAFIIPTSPALINDTSKLPPALTGFAQGIKHLQLIPNTFSPQVKDAISRDVQRLVLGQMSVDEVASDVQSAQDSSQ